MSQMPVTSLVNNHTVHKQNDYISQQYMDVNIHYGLVHEVYIGQINAVKEDFGNYVETKSITKTNLTVQRRTVPPTQLICYTIIKVTKIYVNLLKFVGGPRVKQLSALVRSEVNKIK